MAESLLFELGTEELPPKSLRRLEASLARSVETGFKDMGLLFGKVTSFATPRRLAIVVTELEEHQSAQHVERRGPSIDAAFDDDGKPTRAAVGFARSCGCEVADLTRMETPKGTWLKFSETKPGESVHTLIGPLLSQSLDALPINRRMRWGAGRETFVRPVHWCVLLYGSSIIDASLIGQQTGRESRGHRFMSTGSITLSHADDYAEALRRAHVVVDFAERQSIIREQLLACAKTIGAKVVLDEALLEEVTSLVEWPVALAGSFDERFLAVPNEALISAMTEHQRYFHLVDDSGTLMPRFLTVSNIASTDPEEVVRGNERVILPRLADADFFFRTDSAKPLAEQADRLANVVFQAKLGSYLDKSKRMAALASYLATAVGADPDIAGRAALLSKVDLVSNMVGEFPDLQGIMGSYYAISSNEPDAVATAIRDHYKPIASGGELPSTLEGACVAMADKLDTLVGLFGIGQPPTGSRDPFALRRATLGILRIAIDKELRFDLAEALRTAAELFPDHYEIEAVAAYIADRAGTWYQDQGISSDVFAAAVNGADAYTSILGCHRRVQALSTFAGDPVFDQVTAANKRVANLLQNAQGLDAGPDPALFQTDAEHALHDALIESNEMMEGHADSQEFPAMLRVLAGLQQHVDRYFDDVLVMSDDDRQRANRLATLRFMRNQFLRVADFSLLKG